MKKTQIVMQGYVIIIHISNFDIIIVAVGNTIEVKIDVKIENVNHDATSFNFGSNV